MQCTLMNKNVPLIDLDIDVKTSYIQDINKVHNPEYMPVGITSESGPSKAKLHQWWVGRSIPASRDGLKDVLTSFGLSDVQELVNKSLGLSLSDHYWLKPQNQDIKWEDVNFFTNDFSQDVGDAFFKQGFSKKEVNLMSPDNTSDGWLRKKWISIDRERYLLKAGSKPFQQEPFNEVIASQILEKTRGIPFVKYELHREGDLICSRCKNFITPDTEFVPAYYIQTALPKLAGTTEYAHFLESTNHFEIPGVKKFLNDMITLDYIILNTDRHWGNFGFIRNVNTLKFEGPAPLFDHGTSLWHNEIRITPYQEPSKPFRSTHSKQIRLVSNFDRFKQIKHLSTEIENVLNLSPHIDQGRKDMLQKGIYGRIKNLQRIIERSMEKKINRSISF